MRAAQLLQVFQYYIVHYMLSHLVQCTTSLKLGKEEREHPHGVDILNNIDNETPPAVPELYTEILRSAPECPNVGSQVDIRVSFLSQLLLPGQKVVAWLSCNSHAWEGKGCRA